MWRLAEYPKIRKEYKANLASPQEQNLHFTLFTVIVIMTKYQYSFHYTQVLDFFKGNFCLFVCFSNLAIP